MGFEWIQPFDNAFLSAVQGVNAPWLDTAMNLVTHLGDLRVWMLIAALIYWRGRENDSFFLMNSLLLSVVTGNLLKNTFARPRPSTEIFRNVAANELSTFSFPSGHATTIGAAYGYLSRIVAKKLKILFAVAVIVAAYSRIYLGVHFLSDVLVGLLLGFAIGKVNFHLQKTWSNRHFRLTRLGDEIALVIVIFFAVVALFLIHTPALAGSMLGFYAGFFAWKERKKPSEILRGKRLLVKCAIGFVGVLAILQVFPHTYEGISPLGPLAYVVYFVGGFWISFLWPWIFEKALKRPRQ